MEEMDEVLSKYATSQDLMDQIRYVAESLSIGFDQWDEPYVSGPSLYFLIVAETDFASYTDPLGGDTWPIDRCKVVSRSSEAFQRAAEDVAFSRDGAVVVTGDGTVQEQMVRVRSPAHDEAPGVEDLTHPGWMGTKHMSALETSLRNNVLWAITLSEEDGRVSTFLDGTYKDYPRSEIGGRWRPDA